MSLLDLVPLWLHLEAVMSGGLSGKLKIVSPASQQIQVAPLVMKQTAFCLGAMVALLGIRQIIFVDLVMKTIPVREFVRQEQQLKIKHNKGYFMDYSIPRLRPLGTDANGFCSSGSTATGATYRSCNAGPGVGLDSCFIGDAAASTCSTGYEAESFSGCKNGVSAVDSCNSGNSVSSGKEVCSTGNTAGFCSTGNTVT